MDLLFARYADPFSFVNGMILTDRFTDFVLALWNTNVKEKSDREVWEFFVHRVYDKTFNDFKEELIVQTQNRNMSERAIETTINESMKILQKLSP